MHALAKLSDDDLVALYLGGVPVRKIGANHARILRILKERGIERRRPAVGEEEISRQVNDYLAGVPVRKIVGKTQTLYRRLQRLGIEPDRRHGRDWLPTAQSLRAEGCTYKVIALQVGVPATTVNAALRRAAG